MIEAIKKRRAVRDFLPDAVSDRQLDEIIHAAMYAPSGNSLYPWDLVVVTDETALNKLSKVTPWALHIQKAPLAIAVVGHEEASPHWVEDCSVAAENIWLEATNQGLGSCWVHIRGNDKAEKEVREILNIPDEYRVLCLLPIGRPAQAEEEHTEEDFDRGKIKREKY